MLLLVGGDSEIGAATFTQLRARGRDVAATTRRACGRPDPIWFDLTETLDDWQPPQSTEAACILTSVSHPLECEADPAGSAHINVTRTLALARKLVASGIHVIFLSSDRVFDGRMPHVPADTPAAPLCEYGRQKAYVEAALRDLMARGAPIAILRLAKVMSPQTALLRDWIRALGQGRTIRAFHDKTAAPTLIDAVIDTIDALARDRARGIFQLSGPRDVPYTEIGRYLAARLNADASLVASVSAASAGLPPSAAPPYTTLDSSALRERYGIAIPPAYEVIDRILDRLQLGNVAQNGCALCVT